MAVKRKFACQSFSISLMAPGFVCFAALFVPLLHGTDFWVFSARHWWQLMFAGSVLGMIGLVTCHFVNRD
jgi:hypothetical protein